MGTPVLNPLSPHKLNQQIASEGGGASSSQNKIVQKIQINKQSSIPDDKISTPVEGIRWSGSSYSTNNGLPISLPDSFKKQNEKTLKRLRDSISENDNLYAKRLQK